MKTAFHFNGEIEILLTPESDQDFKLLDLAFNGTKVREIRKPVKDSETKESLTIVLTREQGQ